MIKPIAITAIVMATMTSIRLKPLLSLKMLSMLGLALEYLAMAGGQNPHFSFANRISDRNHTLQRQIGNPTIVERKRRAKIGCE